MKLLSLKVENYRSFERVEIDWDSGITLLLGVNQDAKSADSNGAGKTALMEAIRWILWGETGRGDGPDELIRRGTDKVIGELCFEAGKSEYILKRSRSRKTHKTKVQFLKDGEDITPSTASLVSKSLLPQILGADRDTWLTTHYFGRDSMRFSQMTDSERKTMMEQILDLDQLEKALKWIKTKQSDAEERWGDISGGLEILKSRKEILEDSVKGADERAKREHSRFELSCLEIKASIGQLDLDLEKLEKVDPAPLNEKLKAAQDYRRRLQEEREQHSKHRTEIASEVGGLRAKVENCSQRIKEVDEAIAELTELGSGNCPVCFQNVSAEHVESVTERFWKTRNKELENQRDTQAKLKKKSKAADDAEALAKKANKELRQIDQQTEAINAKLAEVSEILRQREGVESTLKERRARLKGMKNPASVHRAEAVRLRKELKALVPTIEETSQALERLEKEIWLYRWWTTGFGWKGLRGLALRRQASYLESRARRYLRMLTGEELDLRIGTTRELKSGEERLEITLEVRSKTGTAPYTSASGGERQRVDLGLAFGLFDLVRAVRGVGQGPVLMDEIFESLDAAGCEAVSNLLVNQSKAWGQILLITHQTALQDLFPRTVIIEKKGGTSRVVA